MIVLVVAMTVCTGYAAGRIHQWYRTALERDQAYRDGYDTATRSLFSLAARIIRPRRSEKAAVRGTATVTSILAAPSNATPSNAAPSLVGPSTASLPTTPIPTVASADTGQESAGRHTVPDQLVSGPTYRLPPDRVARAKVPQAGEVDEAGEVTLRVEPGEGTIRVDAGEATFQVDAGEATTRVVAVPDPVGAAGCAARTGPAGGRHESATRPGSPTRSERARRGELSAVPDPVDLPRTRAS